MVLAQYPDLVEDFVGFLEPDQAVEAGVVSLLMKLARKNGTSGIIEKVQNKWLFTKCINQSVA